MQKVPLIHSIQSLELTKNQSRRRHPHTRQSLFRIQLSDSRFYSENLLGCVPKCFLNTVLKYFTLTNPVASEASITDIPCFSNSAACSRRIMRMNSCGARPVRDFKRL